VLLLLLSQFVTAADDQWIHLGADNDFAGWQQPIGDWREAGDAMLDPNDPSRLIEKPGAGVLMNRSRTRSLITSQTFQDVQVHLEFMVARGANSGVIFHGNYEIQILDSAHVETPTGAHCGGIYPRAEGDPSTGSYRHFDNGSPPRFNAAKPPGQWQTLDIIFQSPRFDAAGNKTANARFVRVVHNGVVVQENQEVPYAHGPNWDRQQFPQGVIIFQGDYGLVAFRNIRVRPWNGESDLLNLPPKGFTAIFNGKDLTGWHTPPEVLENWFVEDGVLKSPGLVEHYGASLVTKKHYRDFILMLEFRMPTISDSGICFRRLIPEIPGFGNMEQFNLRSRGGMGHLESYYFLPRGIAKRLGLKDEEAPHVRDIDPEVGVWHTVKLTMQGRKFSAEYDGEVLYDNFQFHDWMMNMEPAPILLQKHMVVRGDNLGDENPCPIEYRNVFIKEMRPIDPVKRPLSALGDDQYKATRSPNADLLARIDAGDLPEGYEPARHQEYVDRRFPELSPQQSARVNQLWKEKQAIDPDMPNRGFSFVKILAYVANEHAPAAASPAVAAPLESASAMPIPHPVHHWQWLAETDEDGMTRKAIPVELSEDHTIFVASFGVADGDVPPVVLLPQSRLSVTGRLATGHTIYFGITVNHPNGDFAGRFLTIRSADEFQDGENFEMTLDVQDLQLDSSLADMKDQLPSEPFHFVVESIWFTTLEKDAGLEIAAVKLTPPSS
jgi:hypothetical protein